MSPRIIQIPLSGRDRRHYARELKKAEQIHASLVKRVEDAFRVASQYRRMADKLTCDEWTARMFIGGDIEPSPTLQLAINCGCAFLRVECRACAHSDRVDLREVIWPRQKQVHTLARALTCRNCKAQGNKKSRPNVMGLDTSEPDPPSPREQIMCNLYSMTKRQAAIIALTRAMSAMPVIS